MHWGKGAKFAPHNDKSGGRVAAESIESIACIFVTDILKTENEFMYLFFHFSDACICLHLIYIYT